jgi:hypothetical protein
VQSYRLKASELSEALYGHGPEPDKNVSRETFLAQSRKNFAASLQRFRHVSLQGKLFVARAASPAPGSFARGQRAAYRSPHKQA